MPACLWTTGANRGILGKDKSLDIFIPSIGVAIEYQGIQHYEPVAVFGGEEKLQKRIELDKKKSELCKNNGIVLIEFKYNEPLDQQYIQNKINSYFTEFT